MFRTFYCDFVLHALLASLCFYLRACRVRAGKAVRTAAAVFPYRGNTQKNTYFFVKNVDKGTENL